MNSPHVDWGNKLLATDTEKYLRQSYEHMNDLNEREYEQSSIDFNRYLQNFSDTLGLGVPTTCGYQHIHVDPNIKFHQFFIMEGLGSCVELEDFTIHHFYAHGFVHHTSFCVGINSDNKICVSNPKNSIGSLVGWGTGGKDKSSTNLDNSTLSTSSSLALAMRNNPAQIFVGMPTFDDNNGIL